MGSRSGDGLSDLGCGNVVDGGSEISRAAIRKYPRQPSSRVWYGRKGGRRDQKERLLKGCALGSLQGRQWRHPAVLRKRTGARARSETARLVGTHTLPSQSRGSAPHHYFLIQEGGSAGDPAARGKERDSPDGSCRRLLGKREG